jgi:hypothetical protein
VTIYVSDVVEEVSRQLNDQGLIPYTRWNKGELVVYLNDALIMVGNYRPDAFTSTTDIALVPGAQQTLPTGFSFLKSIDSNATNSNCPGSPVTEANLDILRAFFKKPCMPTGGPADYRVTSFAYDQKNPLIFYVSPPVPTDAAGLEVTATLVGAAPTYATIDITLGTAIAIDPKYKNALTEWMLYRAYQVDTESVSSRQTKLDSYAAFWKILGVEYKQESGYRSGWYLGQKGLGDQTAGSRG